MINGSVNLHISETIKFAGESVEASLEHDDSATPPATPVRTSCVMISVALLPMAVVVPAAAVANTASFSQATGRRDAPTVCSAAVLIELA